MFAPERRRGRSPVWWGVAVLAMAALAAGGLAIGSATAGTAQKGLTKKKADKRYLGNTTAATATSTVPAGTGATITAMCPGGLQATDGGAESPLQFGSSGGDTMAIAETYPVIGGTRSIGWTVEVLNSGSGPTPITAYAVCVP